MQGKHSVLIEFLTCLALTAQAALGGSWATYGHDGRRSGWAAEEKTLSPGNVSQLRLQWKVKLDNEPYSLAALTAPLVATHVATENGVRSVVYIAGVGGTVFAVDARTGEQLWTRALRLTTTPRKAGLQGTFLCPAGITATPVIDERAGTIYEIAADGALYGLDLATGSVTFGPVPFVAPFARSWSLNLFEGSVYTSISLGCGGGRPGVYAADVGNPRQPRLREVLLSDNFSAGIWGRGGVIIGDNGKLYGATADGDPDPQHGNFSNMVVAVSAKDLTVSDYFLPANWKYLKKKDLDEGSASPVWFTWRHRNFIVHGSKDGVIYLLDADHLGGADHQTPLFSIRLGNDNEECCDGTGIWGSLSSSMDADGNTWIYVPMGGPPAAQGPKFPTANGANVHGSIMAFKVQSDPRTGNPTLSPAWISGDFDLPDPPVIANGVLFALSNGENARQRGGEAKRFLDTHPAVLKALDARTGQELFNSGTAMTAWVHFSALAIADGRVYAVDHDSNLYSFGLGDASSGPAVSQTQPPPLRGAGLLGASELSGSWVQEAQNQDRILKIWVKRAAVSASLGLFMAMLGLWAGLRKAARE